MSKLERNNCHGSVLFAKQVVSEARAEKVKREWLGEAEAVELVKKILRKNAWELFNIDEREKGLMLGLRGAWIWSVIWPAGVRVGRC